MKAFIEAIIKFWRFLFSDDEKKDNAVEFEKEEFQYDYQKRKYLFSMAENNFYQVLKSVCTNYEIFAKVRLLDVLKPVGQNWKGGKRKIDAKHIDYLLCSKDTFTPLLIIELDDKSHQRKDRQRRDSFVDQAVEVAGLKILHVRCQTNYNTAVLREKIESEVKIPQMMHHGF